MCLKKIKSFYRFSGEKRRVECKKITCLATKKHGLLLRNIETYAVKVWVAEKWNHRKVSWSYISRVLSVYSPYIGLQLQRLLYTKQRAEIRYFTNLAHTDVIQTTVTFLFVFLQQELLSRSQQKGIHGKSVHAITEAEEWMARADSRRNLHFQLCRVDKKLFGFILLNE